MFLVLLRFLLGSEQIIIHMVKSILPPLHVDTEAATAMRAPGTVSILVVVWVEAKVALPHFCLVSVMFVV
jgi:hypothetical protein